MEEMQQTTKIVLTWELYEQGMPKAHIAERVGVHRETVGEWIKGIMQHEGGLLGFLEDYERAKKGPRKKRKVDGLLKARIYRLREERRTDSVVDKRFRVARPYKKNKQSYIESFNRTLRKECLGWSNYHPKDVPEMNKDLSEYLI